MNPFPVTFVGAGPGDPELLTLKGRRLLDGADLIVYAGSLVNPALLAGVRAEVRDSAPLTLEEITAQLVTGYRSGKRVVRLHTGDPSVFGAIREQMAVLDREAVPYDIVPGVSSVFAAAASLRAELTLPEISQTVILTRRAGRTPVPESQSLRRLAAARATMCIFLSVSMLDEIVAELLAGGYPPDTPVAVVEKASWPEERSLRGCLADVAAKVKAAGIRKTAMILVGAALGADAATPSRLYDQAFNHSCRGISSS